MGARKVCGIPVGSVVLEKIIYIEDDIADGCSIYVCRNSSRYTLFVISNNMELSEDGLEAADYFILCDSAAYDNCCGNELENALFNLLFGKLDICSVIVLTKLFTKPGMYSDDIIFSSFEVIRCGVTIDVYSIDHDKNLVVKS